MENQELGNTPKAPLLLVNDLSEVVENLYDINELELCDLADVVADLPITTPDQFKDSIETIVRQHNLPEV